MDMELGDQGLDRLFREAANRLGQKQFVTAGLHQEWATPAQTKQGLRAAEIKSWLRLYPEFSDSWVVLDDKLSGSGFKMWNSEERSYVVLSQEHVGFREAEHKQLRAALLRRLS